MNVPTILTLIRIIAIPIIVVVFYLPFQYAHYFAAAIFAVAALTDALDGYLARNLGLKTRFGGFLDPVADKLMVAVTLVLIVAEKDIYFLAVPAAVIIGREIVISALREWMAEIGKRASVAVNFMGKIKTQIQMYSLIILLLYKPGAGIWLMWIGAVLLYIAAVLTLWSMFMYLKTAWPDLTLSMENQ